MKKYNTRSVEHCKASEVHGEWGPRKVPEASRKTGHELRERNVATFGGNE